MGNDRPESRDRQPRLARLIAYAVEETSLGFVNLQIRGLTTAEALAILRAARTATGARIDPAGPYLVDTGRGRTSRYSPRQRRELAERACALRQERGGWEKAAAHLGRGVSAATLWRWHDALKKCANCETH
jgi:hypothetical protein